MISDWAYEYEDGKKEFLNLDGIRVSELDLRGEEITDAFMRQQGACFSWQVIWNKLYKRELWNHSTSYFKEILTLKERLTMCEDIIISAVLLFHAEHVVNVHDITYFYSKHPGQSIAGGSDIKKYKENIASVKFTFEYFKNLLEKKNLLGKYENDFFEFRSLYARIWFEIAENFSSSHEAHALYYSVFGDISPMRTTTGDHFFEKFKTGLGETYTWHENMKAAICDPNVEYVSFDIFDTLICRPFWEPSDLFQLMEREFNRLAGSTSFITFRDIRVQSELGCRQWLNQNYPSMEDITLDEIYRYMDEHYGFGIKICEKLKALEIALEVKYCSARKIGKELLELALDVGKKVVLISDMYLSAEIVRMILDKNDISGYSEIFMSSEYRQLKCWGGLYKCFMRKYSITAPDRVLHIGDNWKADIEAAKVIGIRTFHLPSAKEIFTNTHKKIYGGEFYTRIFEYCGNKQDNVRGLVNFLGMRCMLAVIANKIYDRGYVTINKYTDFNVNPYHVGYMALGMHLLAVTDWLIKEQRKNSYEKIHFVARDGWLPKKAFEIVAHALGVDIKADYFYISRKVTTPLQIRNLSDFYSLRSTIYVFSFSPKKLIDILSSILDEKALEHAEDICKKNHFIFEKNFVTEAEYIRFLRILMSEFYSEKRTLTFNKKVSKYLSEKIGENDAIFDIGYSARSESIFSYLLKKKISTYYIHTNQDIAFRRADMFDVNVNTFYDFEPGACVVLREHLFCELGPSCVSYRIDGDDVIPVFEEYRENYKMSFVTKLVQNGALEFVNDFMDVFADRYDEMVYRRFDASMPYEYFMCRAKRLDRQMFSECSFEDDMWQGKNSNFVEFWEGVLTGSKNIEKIAEKPVEEESFDRGQYDNMLNYHYNLHRKNQMPVSAGKTAMFMDKIRPEDSISDKYAKCAGNLSNIVEWEAAETLISPRLIDNWYMTNPGGFSEGDFDVFLTTGLTEIHENDDLTYLGEVLDKIGGCPLVPITAGFSADAEKSDFALGAESVKVLRRIAERCRSIGVKGDYSAEVLNGFGIKNIRIVGTPALYTDSSMRIKVCNSGEKIGSVSGSFKPFYGVLSQQETELLRYFADHSFKFVDEEGFESHDRNIKEKELAEGLRQYMLTGKTYFDVKSWTESFAHTGFAMGMNFSHNVAALMAGIPALFINYETMGRELCRFHRLPSIDINQFDAGKSVEHYYSLADYHEFASQSAQNFEAYKAYLADHGIAIGIFDKRMIEK